MGRREMVTESWFSNLWRTSRKGAPDSGKPVIGVLAFEVAALMSKVVNLWHCLSEGEIQRLREEIASSIGIQKLVSDDDEYLMDLALNEIMQNFGLVARSVARLGRKCIDPPFLRFEDFVNDPIENCLEWCGWQYRLKKMERKVKKMERFVAVTMQLSHELEVLAELERTLRRMRANSNLDRVKLLDFQQKVTWQRQEVRHLRELSPWIRNYDYTVRLLVRSLLTILEQIKLVFDIDEKPTLDGNNALQDVSFSRISRAQSFSVQSLVHPSETLLCGISSGPLGRSGSMSRLAANKDAINGKQRKHHRQLSFLLGKHPHPKANRSAHVGPFKGCMTGIDSPILSNCKPADGGYSRFIVDHRKSIDKPDNSNMRSFSSNSRICCKLALVSSKRGLLDAPPYTLGNAALALRYANVIVLIEKLVSSPCMVDLETRDDLYNMLPATIRTALRVRLQAYAKSLDLIYDANLAEEWSVALAGILDWLSPLAHNMIRWQSERNFEREQEFNRTALLLLQTLHYANQAKTEAAITELLVGLNYICRINRELTEKAVATSYGCRASSDDMGKREYCVYDVA